MVVLDTDHVSLLEWDFEGSAPLRERLADLNPNEVATTIISYEESMRGWMAYIARAKTVANQVEGYQRLRRHLDNYRQIPFWILMKMRVRSFNVFGEHAFVLVPWI